MTPPLLLAVPNVSEGGDAGVIAEIGQAFERSRSAAKSSPRPSAAESGAAASATLLDTHSDRDHGRSVYTLVAQHGALAEAMLRGAAAAVERVDVMSRPSSGQHPHVGALDVAPVVYLDEGARGAACAEALVIADRIAFELDVPVFLYGDLAAGRTRADLRRGGVRGLAERMADGARAPEPGQAVAEGLRPDFGPPRLHPTAGATLVAAREPLVAFNLYLSPPATIDDAHAIAATVREGGPEGLPGVRAIGVAVGEGRAQVSLNIERPLEQPLAVVADAVAKHAPLESAELVGLAPRAALDGFPEDLPLRGFDPERHVIENALRSYGGSDQAQAQVQAPR